MPESIVATSHRHLASSSVETHFPERRDRLHRIVAGSKAVSTFPLMVETAYSRGQFESLAVAVKYYVYLSLINQYGEEEIDFEADLLTTYKKQIKGLNSITPNGLLLPKRETYLAYNLLHRAVARIMQSFGIESHIASIHAPVNVRIVDGTPDSKIDSRPRASIKLHSDIWAGEPSHAMMLFLPVFGELNDVGVELYEPPARFYPDFARPLADFNEGAGLIDGATRYDYQLRQCHAYFMDPYLLHRTIKRRDALRLSIDFRFLSQEHVSSDVDIDTGRLANYVSFDEWCQLGEGRILVSDTRSDAPVSGGEMGAARNQYAASFRTIVP